MGFISYNLNYYKERIKFYESGSLTKNDIYEAKQLLKLVDDLMDEGHYELFYALQKDSAIIDRLKTVIQTAGEKPFWAVASDRAPLKLKDEKIELTEYINHLLVKAKTHARQADNRILFEIKKFCNGIAYNSDCAYIFLLRDTFLPYLFFQNKNAKNIYPYFISRGFFNLLYPNKNVDDVVRAVIFQALENGLKDFKSYFAYCKKEILNKLSSFPNVIIAVKNLLSKIKSKRIVVIETGCYGTFPLLLSALDERVEFKMYATVPYLFQTYKHIIFTTAYENIRLFETLFCHNGLFQITDFIDNRFYVSENENQDIVEKSLAEISGFLKE